MIVCACGMSKWSVEYERVCRQVAEWMVSEWNECDRVAQVENCSQLLWGIYTRTGVCERRERERQEREDRNKESVWKTAFNFSLSGVNGSKGHEQQATNSTLPNKITQSLHGSLKEDSNAVGLSVMAPWHCHRKDVGIFFCVFVLVIFYD